MLACGGEIAPWFASVTFGGPDLRNVYIGSLRGTRIPWFRSPVAGLPMAHWHRVPDFGRGLGQGHRLLDAGIVDQHVGSPPFRDGAHHRLDGSDIAHVGIEEAGFGRADRFQLHACGACGFRIGQSVNRDPRPGGSQGAALSPARYPGRNP
jgi:hypothetical protein